LDVFGRVEIWRMYTTLGPSVLWKRGGSGGSRSSYAQVIPIFHRLSTAIHRIRTGCSRNSQDMHSQPTRSVRHRPAGPRAVGLAADRRDGPRAGDAGALWAAIGRRARLPHGRPTPGDWRPQASQSAGGWRAVGAGGHVGPQVARRVVQVAPRAPGRDGHDRAPQSLLAVDAPPGDDQRVEQPLQVFVGAHFPPRPRLLRIMAIKVNRTTVNPLYNQ